MGALVKINQKNCLNKKKFVNRMEKLMEKAFLLIKGQRINFKEIFNHSSKQKNIH